MNKKKYIIWPLIWLVAGAIIGLYQLGFAPREERYSEEENRMLAGFPELSGGTLSSGEFTGSFETWLLDGFPMRASAIGFSQRMRDGLSFVTYDDYLAVMRSADDPLTSSAGGDVSIEAPPPPAPTRTAAPPTEPPVAAPDSGEATEPNPETVPVMGAVERRAIVFPEKGDPAAQSFPQTMGLFMQTADGAATLQTFGSWYVTSLAEELNQIARLLPEGGAMAFAMVPQSMYANRFVNAAGKTALYSDYEDCVYAYTDNNVMVFSTSEILGEAMMRDEYVYFRTDMHWTPYGTWLVYTRMVEAMGLTPTAYEDFEMTVEEPFLGTYYRDNPMSFMRDNADYLELISPAAPYTYRRLGGDGVFYDAPLLDENARGNDRYTVYLGGPGPWSVIESDNGTGRNCLVLCDSFGLAFVPMLAEQYEEVHYYDPRYFNAYTAGGSLSELIEKYEITDCYVVAGDLHCFGSDFFAQTVGQR